jgi:hypothetical protein
MLYPDTLDHFFRLVEVGFPKEDGEMLRLDAGGKRRGRRDSAVGEKGKRRG